MSNSKKIGIIVHINPVITDTGPLYSSLIRSGFEVVIFANANIRFKSQYNPKLHPEFLNIFSSSEIFWYNTYQDLADQLISSSVSAVFTEEAWPFIFDPKKFQNRAYKILNIVHSVDNCHPRAVSTGVLDQSFVGYEKYGEYLGWDKKDYTALGLPKYDVISSLDVHEIKKKYRLPEKYVIILTPNNNLLNVFVVYKIIRKIRAGGYEVVLKGKAPKCHKRIYRFMAKYFLSNLSFYPFITHELIFASSGVVGFDTTAAEEILMCERPLVNFSVKLYRDRASKEGNFKQFVPMWNAEYCMDIPFFDHRGLGIFKKIPDFLHHFQKKINYQKIQEEVFSVPGGASERIVEWLKKNLS